MAFEKGSYAMIHPDIASFDEYESPTINKSMMEMAGQIGQIEDAGRVVHFQDLDYAWLPKWLIPIEDIQDDIQSVDIQQIL